MTRSNSNSGKSGSGVLEPFLEQVFSTTKFHIAHLDRNFNFIRVNRNYAEATKRAPEDFVGKNHFDLYPDEENEQIFRNVVSSGEVFEISAKPFEHPDQPDRGTTYWDWSLAPVKDEKGKVQTLFLSLYDVTEKTQAELSLKEAEQDYIKVQEVAHFGSWNLDLVKNKLVWSDENYRIFGMPEDRSGNTYERFLEIVHPDDLEYVNRKWTAAVEENAPYDIEHRLLIKGEVRWVREVAKVVHDKQGVAVKGVGITQDITTRKQLEEQLQMRQRMDSLGTLAGGIAHDFNNILVSVLGNLELLSLDSGNFSEDQKECLVDAERGCFRATDLIRQIQSLSQGAVKGRAVIDPYNVSNEVFSLLRRTTDRLIEKQIGFNKGKFFVDANSGDLHQVLLNLAMNSAQAIVEKGVCKSDFIRISADKHVAGENELSGLAEGDYVHISVEDNGTGMSAKTISKAFDPMFTTKRKGGKRGQGLGLAMAYNIVTRICNGHINIESEEGKGTTVHMYLPSTVPETKTDMGTAATELGGKETILIVDDEQSVIKISKRVLTSYGYTVLVATDGNEALNIFNKLSNSINLVILDLTMPEMSGKQVFERMLELDPEVKVLISSGHADDYTRDGILSNAKGCVGKPYRMKELAHSVRAALDS